MSHIDNNLVLYLKLDQLISEHDSQKILNSASACSAIAIDGTITGPIRLVPDEIFGSCLMFKGEESSEKNVIELSNIETISRVITEAFTVEAWVKPAEFQIWGGYIGVLQDYGSNERGWCLGTRNNKFSLAVSSQGKRLTYLQAINTFPSDVWYHVAGVYDGTKMTLYVNGIAALEENFQSGNINYPDSSTNVKFVIGAYKDTDEFFPYKGLMANIRLYNKALTQEEIQRDMEKDLTAASTFRKSYPIKFSLYDNKNDQNVLYLDNDVGAHACRVEIVNTSQQNIELSPLSGTTASADYHHFELKFRPGTLSTASLDQITLPENGWDMSHPPQSDQSVSLYFLSTNSQVISPEDRIQLTLQNVKLDASGGARGTRVELKYQNLKYQGADELLEGFREEHLGIVDHRGKKDIPLHVGSVGSNTILNDGSSQNALTLRMTNLLKESPLPLSSQSKFIFAFESQAEGEKKEWALGTVSQVENISINPQNNNTWQIRKEGQGQSVEWILTPQQSKTELSANEVVQIEISNIISSLSSGYANLYVRYENIPGYWDGKFVVPIEKSPLLYRDFKVGINTSHPSAILDINVKGENSTDSRLKVRKGETDYLTVLNNGNVGIGTTTPGAKLAINGGLHVGGDSDPGDKNLLVDGNIQLGWDHSRDNVDKLMIYQDENFNMGLRRGSRNLILYSKSKQDDAHIDFYPHNQFAMRIDTSGNVGIGTETPTAKLDVYGDLHINGKKPIIIKKYWDTARNGCDTKMDANIHAAAIIGFRCWGGDIDETGGSTATDSNIINVFMSKKNNKWHINVDFRTHNTANSHTETWYVDVMFIRKELVQLEGDWTR